MSIYPTRYVLVSYTVFIFKEGNSAFRLALQNGFMEHAKLLLNRDDTDVTVSVVCYPPAVPCLMLFVGRRYAVDDDMPEC